MTDSILGDRPIAVDARLYGGTSTGDSTYWTALLDALAALPVAPALELFSDRAPPSGYRLPFAWRTLPARSSRWWSLVAFPLATRRHRLAHVQYALSPLARNGVSTVHDVSFRIGPEWFAAKDRTLLDLGVRSAARRARAIITVSESSRSEIEREYPAARGKTVAIANARPPWIRPVPDARERRARLGVEEPYLLTVGTRWARKNHELAVTAADALPDRFPHRLVVTGKAGASAGLGSRGVATGYVSEEDLSALYEGADLYLAPSRHEGFGIPVLEAMGLGCPVLATPAFREAAGEAAEVAPEDEWAERLPALLSDPGKLDGYREAGRDRDRRFTWENSARAHADLYARLR